MARHKRVNVDNPGNESSGVFSSTSRTSPYYGCILLYGPPGCGKTHFLQSTANEFKLPLEFIQCGTLKEELKEGVKTQRFFKKLFSHARESAPSMIILDDIDEVTSKMSLKDHKIRKAVYQLLRELDNIKSGDRLLITATTDRPNLIEPLLFKTRRFNKLIFVPMPNTESRQELFDLFLKDLAKSDDINTKSLSRITRGYNGLDIQKVVNYAHHLADDEDEDIGMEHLENAIDDIRSSLTPDILEPIKKFFVRYKSGTLLEEESAAAPEADVEIDYDEDTDADEELEFEIDESDIEEVDVSAQVDWSEDVEDTSEDDEDFVIEELDEDDEGYSDAEEYEVDDDEEYDDDEDEAEEYDEDEDDDYEEAEDWDDEAEDEYEKEEEDHRKPRYGYDDEYKRRYKDDVEDWDDNEYDDYYRRPRRRPSREYY